MPVGKQYFASHRLIGFRQRPKKAQQRLLVPDRVDIWYMDDRCHSIWCHLCSRCHSYCYGNCVPCYVLSQTEKASLGAGSDYAWREASSARNRCVGCLRTNSTIHGLNVCSRGQLWRNMHGLRLVKPSDQKQYPMNQPTRTAELKPPDEI